MYPGVYAFLRESDARKSYIFCQTGVVVPTIELFALCNFAFYKSPMGLDSGLWTLGSNPPTDK